MNAFRKLTVAGWVLLGCLVLWTASGWACDVPVFRYALEMWEADRYDVYMFRRGPMGAQDEKAIETLKAQTAGEGGVANVTLHVIDLDAPSVEGTADPWRGGPEPTLPHMVVRYPRSLPTWPDLWSGPLSEFNSELLLDSPKRQEIAQRIVDGDTAVWVLLESGDQAKDDAAAALLETQLDVLNKTLKLPELSDRSDFGGADPTPRLELRVALSSLRLSRNDPNEQMFVRMLLQSESDLKTFQEPMAFPIFARGRVLYALVGRGINEGNIREACAFIMGPCSCEIKDLNPGTDILMSVDWEDSIGPTISDMALAPALPSISDVKAAVPQQTSRQEVSPEEVPLVVVDKPATNLVRNIVWVLAVGIGFVVAASIVLFAKKDRASC